MISPFLVRERTGFAPLLGLFLAATLIVTVAVTQIQGSSGAVGANVMDPATASDVVDAGCTPGGSDCAKRISDTIRANNTRPLKVTFGANSPAGSTFTFNSPLVMADNVAVEGVNKPVVSSKAQTMVRVGGLSNASFRNFDINLNRCSTTKNVFFNAPDQRFDNIRLANMRVFNGDSDTGGGGSCVLFASRGTGNDLEMTDVTAEKLRRVVWFNTVSNHRRISINNMNASEFGYQALSFDGYVEDVTIENSNFSRHARNVKGSHIIAFSPAETLTEVKSRNVVVRNTLLEGWPDTPHIKIDGVTVPNGASGDLIAIRGTSGFLIEDSTFRHGGEVGITITAGAQNGVVRNNEISFTDTTGIVIGNGNTIRVTNINVYGNELFENSLDRNNELRTLPALSVWGSTKGCVVHNWIHDNTEASGLWVWNGHLPPHWPRSVFDMYIAENTFSNNLYDFVQSNRPLRNFEPASSSGGTNWTSTYGAPDNDGDGFGTPCSSETDDNDPCVPYTGAAACTDPATPPPTTTPPTTAPPTTAPPTTPAPTTAPPTTPAPTTAPPTTAPSTTVAPTTAPTTAPPTLPSTTAPVPTTAPPTAPSTTGPAPTTTAPPTTGPIVSTPGPVLPTCDGKTATIIGTEGDDMLMGTAGDDVIVGLGGNDYINGKGGLDVICGGDGNDELRGGRANDRIFGGTGDDVIKGGWNNDVLSGGDGNDIMFGNSGRDTIFGGIGNDTIRGNTDQDVLDGGSGDDYLAGNHGRDNLNGGGDADTLRGGSHNDILAGGDAQDSCAGGLGRDDVSACERATAPADEYDYKKDDGDFD